MKTNTTVVSKLARSFAQLAATLLTAVLISLAIPASAGTIGISNGTLIVGTESGDGSQVFDPTISGQNIVFSNLNFDVVTSGCSASGGLISCALADFQHLVILGGTGDDVLQLSDLHAPAFAIDALGEGGDDVLVGTPGNNINLFGGPGDDVITGMTGNCSSRGTGADVVINGGCFAGPDPTFSPLPRPVTATPEPGSLLLLATGLVSLAGIRRKRLSAYMWGPGALAGQVE